MFPVTTKLSNKFLLDYRLTQAPTVQTAYLETYHKVSGHICVASSLGKLCTSVEYTPQGKWTHLCCCDYGNKMVFELNSEAYLTICLCLFLQGEIYWLNDTSTECPFVPAPMPDSPDTQNMLYLWVSDYMFDTIGYVAQKHGFLKHNVTTNDVSASCKLLYNYKITLYKSIYVYIRLYKSI